MCSNAYQCVLICTDVYSCTRMCIDECCSVLMCTDIHWCLSMCNVDAHWCVLMCTYDYKCVLMADVYWCVLMSDTHLNMTRWDRSKLNRIKHKPLSRPRPKRLSENSMGKQTEPNYQEGMHSHARREKTDSDWRAFCFVGVGKDSKPIMIVTRRNDSSIINLLSILMSTTNNSMWDSLVIGRWGWKTRH